MAVLDFLKPKTPGSFNVKASDVLKIKNDPSFVEAKLINYLIEASGKGVISSSSEIRNLNKEEGEERLIDVEIFEHVVTHVPLVAAAIDLTVDFAVSPGLYVTSENDKVIKSCNSLMERLNFDILLRQIVKYMLVYGECFVEIVKNEDSGEGVISNLKILHPKTMRVVRDETGEIEGYLQILGTGKEPIKFTPEEIVHFIYNKIGDRAYGTSIMEPLLPVLAMKLAAERDAAFILSRKANAPYHVKLGTPDYPPSDSDIAGFASELAVLKAKNEWVTSYLADISIISTKDKSMDFTPFFQHYDNQVVYELRVPYVLLGLGNIPEGLAKVQMEAFNRHITSIHSAVQIPLEQQIFSIEASEISEENLPKLKWGKQSMKEKLDEVQAYLAMIESDLTDDTKTDIENKIRDLLGIQANIKVEDRRADQERKQQMFSQGDEEDGNKDSFDKGDKQGPGKPKVGSKKPKVKPRISDKERSTDRT